MPENPTPKVEVVVTQGPPPVPTKEYKVKPGSKLYVTDLRRYAYDDEVVNLTDVAAEAFKDKLYPTPRLGAVVAQVTKSAGNDKLLTPDKRSDATEEAAKAAAAANTGKTDASGSTPAPK